MKAFIFSLLLPATLAAQDPEQIALLRGQIGVNPEPGSLLATPARLTVSGLPLSEALSRLAERSRVRIAFSPTLLPEDHRVECDCAALNTARALDQLLAGTDLGYVELGSQVVVVPRAPQEVPCLDGTIRGRIRTEVAVPMADATARNQSGTSSGWPARAGGSARGGATRTCSPNHSCRRPSPTTCRTRRPGSRPGPGEGAGCGSPPIRAGTWRTARTSSASATRTRGPARRH